MDGPGFDLVNRVVFYEFCVGPSACVCLIYIAFLLVVGRHSTTSERQNIAVSYFE
jgi:hypothetical protein